MTQASSLARGVGLGIASAMRSCVCPAAVSARGIAGKRLRFAVFAAAVGEMVADKQPGMAARTDPRGWGVRVAGAAATGAVVAGRRGALSAALVAAVATPACMRLRAAATRRSGSLLAPAFAEDALAITLAAAATHGR